jgi:phosphoribosylformylglycinamidine synthase I
MTIKIAIIQFPGSNCERETAMAVERAEMQPIDFLWNEAPEKFAACDGYIIIGGFSYEDRVRAGIIASLDPLMQHIVHASQIGKPVLGICNGAQILVESGLVPGLEDQKLAAALAVNKRIKNGHILGTGFYNDWVNITTITPQPHHAFLRNLAVNQPICIPTAHAEGRFILADGLYDQMLAANVGMLYYSGDNPNGSEHNLAAISNLAGNVMAIMPHPERTKAGDAIFTSMRDYINDLSSPNCSLSSPRRRGSSPNNIFSGFPPSRE